MLLAIAIAAFYLDGPVGTIAGLGGACLLIGMAGIGPAMPQGSARQTSGGSLAGSVSRRTLGIAVATSIFVIATAPDALFRSGPATLLLLLLVCLTPFSFALQRNLRAAAAWPALIAAVQIALIGTLLALDGGGPSHESAVRAEPVRATAVFVVLAMLGALSGVLIYLLRMPWRMHPGISLGSATALSVGLVVAWVATSTVGGNVTSVAGVAMALAWILAPVVVDSMSRLIRSPATTGGLSSGHALLVMNVALGGIGILLWRYSVPVRWSVLALVATLVLWLVLQLLSPSASVRRSSLAGRHGW